MKFNEHDAHRILAEAKATVARLRDSEQRFAAEREALVKAQAHPDISNIENASVETRNQRHRREITEQEERFKRERAQQNREQARQTQNNWANWADARIATAIASERRVVCATIGEEVRKAIEMIYDDMAEQVKAMQLEITTLRSTLEASVEQLRGLVQADKAKVIDMPSPLRRAN